MSIDVSIIVPIYNVELYIQKAVESLLNQVNYSFELILVDDGSSDNSGIICDKLKSLHPNEIKVIHKSNAGLPSARKTGVQLAEGKYISFLDGDDFCGPDYYYNMLDVASKYDSDIICSGYTFYYSNGSEKEVSLQYSGLYENEKLLELKEQMLYKDPYYTFGIHPSVCMKLIKKELLCNYIFDVPDDVSLAEDALCSYPMLFAAKKIYVLNDNNKYFYRQINSSMTSAYDKHKIHKIIQALDKMNSLLEPYYEKFGRQIDMYFTWIIKDAVANESRTKKLSNSNIKLLKELHGRYYILRAIKSVLCDVPAKYRFILYLFYMEKYAIAINLIKIRTFFKKFKF